MTKIIRTITFFAEKPTNTLIQRCRTLKNRFISAGFEVQTLRFCCPALSIRQIANDWAEPDFFWTVGTLSLQQAQAQIDDFLEIEAPIFFNIGVDNRPEAADIDFWWQLAKSNAQRTFRFSYTFANAWDSPFFPAARSQRNGFSVGLQSINLAADCQNPAEWKAKMQAIWAEIQTLLADQADFLGIDTSIAPMGGGEGSLLTAIARWQGGDWQTAILSDFFADFSRFIKYESPCPVGICGWFLPCLEDAGLAKAYEQGQFNTERNLFLSLHSAAGIDTYPVGLDDSPERMLQILRLVAALANKYQKPLSVRWISDGITTIGKRSQFNNQFLQEAVIQAL